MLSIIVSSYQTEYFAQFSYNVKETIGDNFEYEIIQQWNPAIMGICEAYNKGAEQAQYDNLLFVHEDVIFETNNWGTILIDCLKDETTGCIGVAGANYIPNTPTPWWVIGNYKDSHLAHFNKKTNKRYDYTFSSDHGILPSKILDGVFLACRKEIWKQIKFNEELKGFHGYDINFSLAASQIKQNYILNTINIVHFSHGSLSKDWLTDVILAYKLANIRSQNNDKETELIAFKHLADQLRAQKFPKKERLLNLLNYFSWQHLRLAGMYKAAKIMFNTYRY